MEIEEEEEKVTVNEYEAAKEDKEIDNEFEITKREITKREITKRIEERKRKEQEEEKNYPKFGDPLPGGGFVGDGTTPYRCPGAPGGIYDYS